MAQTNDLYDRGQTDNDLSGVNTFHRSHCFGEIISRQQGVLIDGFPLSAPPPPVCLLHSRGKNAAEMYDGVVVVAASDFDTTGSQKFFLYRFAHFHCLVSVSSSVPAPAYVFIFVSRFSFSDFAFSCPLE